MKIFHLLLLSALNPASATQEPDRPSSLSSALHLNPTKTEEPRKRTNLRNPSDIVFETKLNVLETPITADKVDNGSIVNLDEPLLCPQDMKKCPDGSLVGRGENCKFRPCPDVQVPEEEITEPKSCKKFGEWCGDEKFLFGLSTGKTGCLLNHDECCSKEIVNDGDMVLGIQNYKCGNPLTCKKWKEPCTGSYNCNDCCLPEKGIDLELKCVEPDPGTVTAGGMGTCTVSSCEPDGKECGYDGWRHDKGCYKNVKECCSGKIEPSGRNEWGTVYYKCGESPPCSM